VVPWYKKRIKKFKTLFFQGLLSMGPSLISIHKMGQKFYTYHGLCQLQIAKIDFCTRSKMRNSRFITWYSSWELIFIINIYLIRNDWFLNIFLSTLSLKLFSFARNSFLPCFLMYFHVFSQIAFVKTSIITQLAFVRLYL
jgi:hypothetical protein